MEGNDANGINYLFLCTLCVANATGLLRWKMSWISHLSTASMFWSDFIGQLLF